MTRKITFEINKLVRDEIPSLHEEQGATLHTEELHGVDLRRALIEKLIEEARELDPENPAVNVIELGDVKQVYFALLKAFGFEDREVEMVRKETKQEKGGFDKGLFATHVEVPENSGLARYYGSNPDRFPVIR